MKTRSKNSTPLNQESKNSSQKRSRPDDEMLPNNKTKKVLTNDDVTDWKLWVAATSTRNYLLDDGFLDVLKENSGALTKVKQDYQNKFVETIGRENSNSFVTSIMNQGIKFEKKVIQLLSQMVKPGDFVNIGGDINPRSYDKYLKTLESIKSGIPVIYQGILRNYSNQTYGVPDLLIRYDYLAKIFKNPPKISKFPKNKYVVVDIKFKTLHFKCDGIHLRNDGPMKAYKSQLCVYNEALSIMQNYKSNCAFILGWKWKYVSKTVEYRGDNCFDKLGKIGYASGDKEFVQKTHEAIRWVRDVRQNSWKWDLSKTPLPREELYPNMCNRYDYPYHSIKAKFAEDIEEISLVWKCGPKQRKIAHDNGIYSWKDPKCSAEAFGIGGEYTSTILDRILEANSSVSDIIVPKYISNNFCNWKNRGQLEFFVDFEMTCSVFTEFDDLPYADGESLIFMIGVGYITPGNEWIYKDFTVKYLTQSEELNICQEFLEYISQIAAEYESFESPALHHWSHAEPSAWKRAIQRHQIDSHYWSDLNWVDDLKIFHNEPVGINGCLNFSLKNVAKTLHGHGCIKTTWDEYGSCADGADAAVGAYKIDKEISKNNLLFTDHPLTSEIIRYNEVDCKVLQEIIEYLRGNHVNPEDSDLEGEYDEIVLYDDSE